MENLDELLICRLDSGRKKVEPCSIIIFGASGELTARKLIPALYHLFTNGLMPETFRIVGFARSEKSHDQWRQEMREALARYTSDPVEAASWERFAGQMLYCRGDYGDAGAYERLKQQIDSWNQPLLRRNLLCYLATPPSQFCVVAESLAAVGLVQKDNGQGGWQRLVIEKPFGHDLPSARQLNHELTRHVHEQQIFRIDHYLGKETVQNILVFRFANAIFEQLWGRHSIEHVQITVSEKAGVGSRGGYYEEAGALRDMVQNHLLQVMALIAMEPPVSLEGEAIRDEKVKLLKSIRPLVGEEAIRRSAVRGQYIAGEINGQPRPAYRQEPHVKPDSRVETYAVLRLLVDNWRWSGVPFYLRTGKNLGATVSEVRIQFRPPPHVLFAAMCGPRLDSNTINIRLQPDEGITLRTNGKIPGTSTQLRSVRMRFSYDTEFKAYTPEAYERLLLEALAGDPTLFIRRDEVEAAWGLIDPIREFWQSQPMEANSFYPAGTWGPAAAEQLISADGRQWRNPTE